MPLVAVQPACFVCWQWAEAGGLLVSLGLLTSGLSLEKVAWGFHERLVLGLVREMAFVNPHLYFFVTGSFRMWSGLTAVRSRLRGEGSVLQHVAQCGWGRGEPCLREFEISKYN